MIMIYLMIVLNNILLDTITIIIIIIIIIIAIRITIAISIAIAVTIYNTITIMTITMTISIESEVQFSDSTVIPFFPYSYQAFGRPFGLRENDIKFSFLE